MKRISLYLVTLLIWLALDSAHRAERVVVYSWPKTMQADERGSYPIELLRLALSKSNRSIVALPSEFVMSHYRPLKQLEMNRGIPQTLIQRIELCANNIVFRILKDGLSS